VDRIIIIIIIIIKSLDFHSCTVCHILDMVHGTMFFDRDGIKYLLIADQLLRLSNVGRPVSR
jgi:hypothetical protein